MQKGGFTHLFTGRGLGGVKKTVGGTENLRATKKAKEPTFAEINKPTPGCKQTPLLRGGKKGS